jgi:hypothetical protein
MMPQIYLNPKKDAKEMHIHNECFAPNYLQWNSLLLQWILSRVITQLPFLSFLCQFGRQNGPAEDVFCLRSKEITVPPSFTHATFTKYRHGFKLMIKLR